MKNSKAQIVATIGPASDSREVIQAMLAHGLDIVRLNFSWSDFTERATQIGLIRELALTAGRKIPIIIDLPGPRVSGENGHTYNHEASSLFTEDDVKSIQFAVEQNVEYLAVSFVGKAADILECREIIARFGGGQNGGQKIIAKIERAVALETLDEIIAAADAVMVARGDLGKEIPLEKIPFVQVQIIRAAKKAGKPVIVATEMLFSMVDHALPTRAEVTDVTEAILQGADAVMLSEETARGSFPVEAVAMMEKILLESEQHLSEQNGAAKAQTNPL